ncbi:MAG TPA: arsenate reductase ArsC [Desulfobacteraceae bacterium]|nr:arsenate reductase ArsC [Desulfobacteraceae bacterium]
MTEKHSILYLCTGNSCRSQMAEAWTNTFKGDQFKAFSAGVEPKKIDMRAVRAMAESGIDISAQKPKDIDSLGDMEFDYVVTLCDNARESCPFFPARIRLLHRGFDDPPVLASGITDDEMAMEQYRRVRDEIRSFVEKMPEVLVEE